jgi:uncharacterized protein
MHFSTIRLMIVAIAGLAQLYLFFRIEKAIRSSRHSARFKSCAITLIGSVMGLLLLMNGYVVAKPVSWVDPPIVARALLFYLPAVWAIGSIFSCLLLCLFQIVGSLWRISTKPIHSSNGHNPSSPENHDRRRFLRAGAAGLATAPFILSAYGAARSSKVYAIEEVTLPFGCPLTVVQLTDIHAGVYMTREEMRRYADQVAALQPDLFVLTGDFISNSMVFLPGCMAEMSKVQARYGTFASLGNHENWLGRPSDFQAAFRRYGIRLLVNTNQIIQTERGLFAVAGIDDVRTGHPSLGSALQGLKPSIPTLLLSHRPEIFPQAAARRVPLTLAGHYHGGQIKLSLGRVDISLAHLRTPYPEGLYRINSSHLYVSRGIGTTFTPVRLNAPPEITVLHLT